MCFGAGATATAFSPRRHQNARLMLIENVVAVGV